MLEIDREAKAHIPLEPSKKDTKSAIDAPILSDAGKTTAFERLPDEIIQQCVLQPLHGKTVPADIY